jgi:hypothetical protein
MAAQKDLCDLRDLCENNLRLAGRLRPIIREIKNNLWKQNL